MLSRTNAKVRNSSGLDPDSNKLALGQVGLETKENTKDDKEMTCQRSRDKKWVKE